MPVCAFKQYEKVNIIQSRVDLTESELKTVELVHLFIMPHLGCRRLNRLSVLTGRPMIAS